MVEERYHYKHVQMIVQQELLYGQQSKNKKVGPSKEGPFVMQKKCYFKIALFI